MTYTEFYQRFSAYPTADIINITRERENYQPEAVLAAETLLRERGVTAMDEEEAEKSFSDRKEVRRKKAERVESYKAVVADLVQPVVQPTAEVDPRKWYRLFLVVTVLLYGYSWYWFIREHVLRRYRDFTVIAISAGDLLWESFLLVLVIKKNRWGWILLFCQNTVLGFAKVTEIISMLRYVRFWYRPEGDVWSFLIHLGFVLFLWRQQMADFFGVSVEVKKRTLWVGIGLGVALSGIALISQIIGR